MLTRIISVACMSMLCQSVVTAQNLPPEIQSMFPKGKEGNKQHRSIEKVSKAERDMLMRDTTINKAGYLRVEVPIQYIEQLKNLVKSRDYTENSGLNYQVMGLDFLGTRAESANRKTYFFGDREHVRATLTVWNYARDGASFTVFDEFINQSVDGLNGTLSLATASGKPDCFWKLTLSDDHTMYEVMLPDVVNKGGQTIMPPQKVMVEARKFIDLASSL